ncbi:PepSY domain-containing protein [Halomonas halodenitrificans]|uniref:PepSY domain-containing protein n=1 Tax=Halomonas halodenitrificans TaxID=28252 RepID=UPI0005BD8D04|nr:PepSY domain-containing protein [Halomonas halodenitrificans]
MMTASPLPRFLLRLGLPMLAALLLQGTAPAWADNDWQDLHAAVREERIVPLPTLLDWLEAHYVGQVLEVELERDDDRLAYEIEMLGPQGQVVEFEFDAESGELVGMEGVRIDAMRRREDAP